jgi:N4-gp56 family major capsid protein
MEQQETAVEEKLAQAEQEASAEPEQPEVNVEVQVTEDLSEKIAQRILEAFQQILPKESEEEKPEPKSLAVNKECPYEKIATALREAINTSGAAAALPDIWAPDISRLPAGLPASLRDFVKVYPQIRGRPGDTFKIPRITTPEFGALTEGTAPSEVSYTIDTVDVTLSEYGATISLTYSVLEDITGDLVRTIEDGFIEAARLQEDSSILSALNAATPAATLYGGDATDTASVDAADVFSPDLIAKALKEIMEEGYGTRPGSCVLVLHPKQYQALLTNSQFTNAATLGSPDVIRTGIISNYMGVDIVVSTKVPVTAATSLDGVNPVVDVYHAFLMRKDAVALVPKRDLLVESEKDTQARVLKLTASHRFGCAVVFPKAVVEIQTA